MDRSAQSSPLLSNRYQLMHTLGTGGMALVYRAYDRMLERPVAIKVLRQNFSGDETFRERFRQEARSAANLSHPNIVTVHDFGFDDGKIFIVMEYVPGTDLKTMIKQHGMFQKQEALALFIQACEGIGYAHRAGLVHCDVKPHNILVTPDSRVKVTDFGIARALASINPNEQADVVWGSPQYFSPEQAAGQAPSPASDVYSLGVILYEMLTGHLPFNGSSPEELSRQHRHSTPTAPRRYNPQIEPALEQIILKVLSKEPSQRYRSADQLGRVLRGLTERQESFSTTAVSPAVNTRPQRATDTVPNMPAYQTQPQAAQDYNAARVYTAPTAFPPQQASRPVEEDPLRGIDWGTIFLGLIAALAVGGLFPFWLYIYLSMNPPVR